jgi:hypothetical protein
MKLKKNLHIILDEIQNDAYCAAKNKFDAMCGYNSNGSPAILNSDALSRMIADAVRSGVETLVENQYTDEDFESDIGLK